MSREKYIGMDLHQATISVGNCGVLPTFLFFSGSGGYARHD